MELFVLLLSSSLAVAESACPPVLTSQAEDFLLTYQKHNNNKSPKRLPLTNVLKRNQAVFAPGLYRDLLAAASREPSSGRAYIGSDPFFGHQVSTFSFKALGCRLISPNVGMVEFVQSAGISPDRSSTSCFFVEMAKQNNRWLIRDVLNQSPEDEPKASDPPISRCSLNSSYSRLSKGLRWILAN